MTDAGVCYPKSDSFPFVVLRGTNLDEVYALLGSILSRIQVDRMQEEVRYFGVDAKEHIQLHPNQYRLEFHMELEYESLATHSLFVPTELRANFAPKQTA